MKFAFPTSPRASSLPMPGDDTLPLFGAQLPNLAWLTNGDRVPVPNSSEAVGAAP